jgi:formylglycine-generating enzyme required for sulfatase activity
VIRSAQLLVVVSLVLVNGCGASSAIATAPRVASLEAKGEASWAQELSRETEPPRETEAPHETAYSAFPDRMARIAGASFELDVTEVTVDAYARCVTAGACTRPVPEGQSSELTIPARCNWGAADRGTHPINCVSFSQATAYCTWAGKRLPTSAERAVTATGMDGDRRYPWGDGPARKGRTDVCAGDDPGTCAVGSHPFDTTPDGVKDLGGNVTDWVDPSSGMHPDAARRGHLMGIRCARDSR